MARLQRRGEGPRFSYHYVDRVRRASLLDMSSNADIARVLQRVDPHITVSHVVRWRNEFARFERACNDALNEELEKVADVVLEAALDGDIAAARYILDRRAPAFMPKSKSETGFTRETLDEMMKRRALGDDELMAQGVIRPRAPERDELDDDE